jgi:hypothetical protein
MCAPTPGSGPNAAANAAAAVRMASHPFELMDQIHRQQQQEEVDQRGQAGPHARSAPAPPGQQRARRRRQPKQQRQHHSPRTTVTIDQIREELRLIHANAATPEDRERIRGDIMGALAAITASDAAAEATAADNTATDSTDEASAVHVAPAAAAAAAAAAANVQGDTRADWLAFLVVIGMVGTAAAFGTDVFHSAGLARGVNLPAVFQAILRDALRLPR